MRSRAVFAGVPRSAATRSASRCGAPADFEQERGMLEQEILAFACPTCGRGLVVDLMVTSRMPEELPRAGEAPE
ncbi:MAG: hypothetical protein M3R38_29230 [Actinomycetota bacterium]|nr:hypothetical protein [Actinomycetota bacterium]MDP9486919.1 hypothetical protein [Actinomycetota bacterium]